MGIREEEILRRLKEMVAINSINPDVEKGGHGEGKMVDYLAKEFQAMGIPYEIQEVLPGRPNLIARVNGNPGGPKLVWNAHTDTVGIQGMTHGLQGLRKKDRFYGRGSQDMKGSIAAMLEAAHYFHQHPAPFTGELYLALVADEEYGSKGTEALLDRYSFDAALVTEPSDLKICTAHMGFALFKLRIQGKAAHGALHQVGLDANMQLAFVLPALQLYREQLLQGDPHPLLGTASLHIPQIHGGSGPFVYAENCSLLIEVRSLPGTGIEQIERDLKQLMKKVQEKQPRLEFELNREIYREPFEQDQQSPWVQAFVQARKELISTMGTEGPFIGHLWWEDSALFKAKGTDTLVLGPVGDGLHSAVEWVSLNSLKKLAELLILGSQNYFDTSVSH